MFGIDEILTLLLLVRRQVGSLFFRLKLGRKVTVLEAVIIRISINSILATLVPLPSTLRALSILIALVAGKHTRTQSLNILDSQ